MFKDMGEKKSYIGCIGSLQNFSIALIVRSAEYSIHL